MNVWRTVLLVAATLALLWQSLIVQGHVHAYSNAGIAAAGNAKVQAGVSSGRSAPEQPANCPICQEIAYAGAYLLPAPVIFKAPEPEAVWLGTVAYLKSAHLSASHAWRSRAPPIPLPA